MSGWKAWRTPIGPCAGVVAPDGQHYLLAPYISADLERELADYLRRGGKVEYEIDVRLSGLLADIPRAERLAADLNAGGGRCERAKRELGI